MKTKKILILLISFAIAFQLFAEQADIPDFDKVDFNVAQVRDLINNDKVEEGFKILVTNTHSKDAKTRSRAYDLLKLLLFKNQPEYRVQVVELFTTKLDDKNNSRKIYLSLLNSSPEYYSKQAKENLLSYFNKNGKFSKVLGHANVTEAIPELRKKLAEANEKNLEGSFKYHQVLARMGDKEEIDYCIASLDRKIYKSAEKWVKNAPDKNIQKMIEIGRASNADIYAYISQPEAIDILKKILFLKDEPDLKPPHRQSNKYGFDGLIECLKIKDAIMIEDQYRGYRPTKKNIELLRKWMEEKYSPKTIKSLSVLVDRQLVNNYTGEKITLPPSKPYDQKPLPFSLKPFESSDAYIVFSDNSHRLDGVSTVYKQQRIGYIIGAQCKKEVYYAKIGFISKEAIMHGPYYRYFFAKKFKGPFETIGLIGQYLNGKKDGLFTYLYKNRKVSMQVQYKQGQKEGIEKKWNEDGILIRRTAYINNKKYGSEKFYNKEGLIMKECHYKNDKRDGIQKEYNKDGTIKFKIIYKKGSPWNGILVAGKFIKKLGRPVTYVYEYKDGKILKASIYKPK